MALPTLKSATLIPDDDVFSSQSFSGPSKPSIPNDDAFSSRSSSSSPKPSHSSPTKVAPSIQWIQAFHVVLVFLLPPFDKNAAYYESKHCETKATCSFHDMLREYERGKMEEDDEEIPIMQRRREGDFIILSNRRSDWRNPSDGPTHGWKGSDTAEFAIVDPMLLDEIVSDYRGIWRKCIPRHPDERRERVRDIENEFCSWQQEHLAPQLQEGNNNSQRSVTLHGKLHAEVEKLRFVLQLLKKMMNPQTQSTDPANTAPSNLREDMLAAHMRLAHKGWDSIRRNATSPCHTATDGIEKGSLSDHTLLPPDKRIRHDASAKEQSHNDEIIKKASTHNPFKGSLPKTRDARLQYVQRLEESYKIWREESPVPSLVQHNILEAFEQLIRQTLDLLLRNNIDRPQTEKQLSFFLDLLQKRWAEFHGMTVMYTPIIMMQESRNDGNDDGSLKDYDSCATVGSYAYMIPQEDQLVSKPKRKKTDVPDQKQPKKIKTKHCDSEIKEERANREETHAPPSPVPLGRSKTVLSDSHFEKTFLALPRDYDDDDEMSQLSAPFAPRLDPNPIRSDATRALFRATDLADMSQIQYWIVQGASLYCQDDFGYSPLHRAAAGGNLEILQHLRLWGCHPRQANHAGEYPVHVACASGHTEATEFLLETTLQPGRDKDRVSSYSSLVDGQGRTLLHHAAWNGHITVARLLLKQFGAKSIINLTDKNNLTARHYALLDGHDEMLEFLDEMGAVADAFDPKSLHQACAEGRLGWVQWIVDSQNADLYAREGGRTPLECAEQAGHEHVANWIRSYLNGPINARKLLEKEHGVLRAS
jgi:ankyrin repeat protein